uniref:DBIRD complex subunit ZNF326-like isoform X1 n=2 Tax=Myxine glutinosa TaxID=7769 RepID=UPI00358E7EFC
MQSKMSRPPGARSHPSIPPLLPPRRPGVLPTPSTVWLDSLRGGRLREAAHVGRVALLPFPTRLSPKAVDVRVPWSRDQRPGSMQASTWFPSAASPQPLLRIPPAPGPIPPLLPFKFRTGLSLPTGIRPLLSSQSSGPILPLVKRKAGIPLMKAPQSKFPRLPPLVSQDKREDKLKVEYMKQTKCSTEDLRLRFCCPLCKFRTLAEDDVKEHYKSAVHKDAIQEIATHLPAELNLAEYMHDYVVARNKKVLTRRRRKCIPDGRPSLEGVELDECFRYVPLLHCRACDTLLPLMPGRVREHMASSSHQAIKKVYLNRQKDNVVRVTKSILRHKRVQEKYERFKKGENPFEEDAGEESDAASSEDEFTNDANFNESDTSSIKSRSGSTVKPEILDGARRLPNSGKLTSVPLLGDAQNKGDGTSKDVKSEAIGTDAVTMETEEAKTVSDVEGKEPFSLTNEKDLKSQEGEFEGKVNESDPCCEVKVLCEETQPNGSNKTESVMDEGIGEQNSNVQLQDAGASARHAAESPGKDLQSPVKEDSVELKCVATDTPKSVRSTRVCPKSSGSTGRKGLSACTSNKRTK